MSVDLVTLVAAVSAGGVITLLKGLVDVGAKRRAALREDLAAPLSERELAQLPELERTRRKLDDLDAYVRELHMTVTKLTGEVMAAATQARAMEARAVDAERRHDEAQTARALALEACRAAERQLEEMRLRFVNVCAERDALILDLAAERARGGRNADGTQRVRAVKDDGKS